MNTPFLTQVIRYEADVVAARQRVRQLSILLGFNVQNQTRIATAVSEIVRNAFEYAKEAKAEYYIEDTPRQQVFMIRVSDNGPGIANVDAILRGEIQPSAGLVSGIVGAKRLMDHFHIQSLVGSGTTVVLGKALPQETRKITAHDIGRIGAEL